MEPTRTLVLVRVSDGDGTGDSDEDIGNKSMCVCKVMWQLAFGSESGIG